jgi:L-amino acid N-acyltransferase YncA
VVIQEIYAHHVLHGTASFELTPPTLDDMRQRRADVVAKNLPYLVAEQNGVVVGYAYVTLYRPRPAYRFTVEDSVYVREGLVGQGIGSLLLAEIIKICTAKGYRQLMAVVANSASTTGAVKINSRICASASTRRKPCTSKPLATVDFPHPIPPVTPTIIRSPRVKADLSFLRLFANL